jgi:hypothetical protein
MVTKGYQKGVYDWVTKGIEGEVLAYPGSPPIRRAPICRFGRPAGARS